MINAAPISFKDIEDALGQPLPAIPEDGDYAFDTINIGSPTSGQTISIVNTKVTVAIMVHATPVLCDMFHDLARGDGANIDESVKLIHLEGVKQGQDSVRLQLMEHFGQSFPDAEEEENIRAVLARIKQAVENKALYTPIDKSYPPTIEGLEL